MSSASSHSGTTDLRRVVGVLAVVGLVLTPRSAWSVDCIHSAFEDEVNDMLADAEGQYRDRADGEFGRTTDGILEELRCLDEPVSTPFSARMHRVLGLRARADQAEELSLAAFAAARLLDPEYTFPSDVLGERDPERVAYDGAPASMVVTVTVPQPKDGVVWFDGKQTRERPANAPTYYQRFDIEDRIVESAWLGPSDAVPPYPAVPDHVPEEVESQKKTAKIIGTALSAGLLGGGAGMVAIGTWDPGNICIAVTQKECDLAAKERVLFGGVMAGIGVGGLVGSQFLFAASPGRATLRLTGRW